MAIGVGRDGGWWWKMKQKLCDGTDLPSCFYRVFTQFTHCTSYRLVVLRFTQFYRVLPGFTGFYWVLLGFIGFYRVLPSFLLGMDLFLLGFTQFIDCTSYRLAVLRFTEFYRVLPSFTEFYRVLLGFTGFYWVLQGFTGFYRVFSSLNGLVFTGFYLVY